VNHGVLEMETYDGELGIDDGTTNKAQRILIAGGVPGVANGMAPAYYINSKILSATQGTANFVNPRVTIDVLEGIERYLSENGISDIKELIGAAHG
jgi:dihydroorotate dehydrogenase